MDNATLELTLCQLIKISEASKKNSYAYSDLKKLSFHKEIDSLLSEVRKIKFEELSQVDKNLHKQLFEILFVWLEFLDNSTLNNIPYEIIRCLEVVLEEWLDKQDFEKYVIVTIPQSKQISFSYWDPELGDTLTDYLIEKYKKPIINTLVPINLPKYLVHDYLANVTLYHELGHFIDRHYRISQKIVDTDATFKSFNDTEREKKHNHLSEFFADIFAAQYIGNKCSIYLNHIANDENDCHTHPSTESRIDIVDTFLAGKDNAIIKMLNEYTKALTGRELKTLRYSDIAVDDFDDLLPAEITKKEQLHFLFIQGWDAWFRTDGGIRETFPNSMDRYRVINNLIEKSLSNFIIVEKWTKSNVPD